VGFEPTGHFWRPRALQARRFDRSRTSPVSIPAPLHKRYTSIVHDGEGGIRTPRYHKGTVDFESTAFNHSPLIFFTFPPTPLRPMGLPVVIEWSYIGHQFRTFSILHDVAENVETPRENTPTSTAPKREEQGVFPRNKACSSYSGEREAISVPPG
jgi:hypothetical protein